MQPIERPRLNAVHDDTGHQQRLLLLGVPRAKFDGNRLRTIPEYDVGRQELLAGWNPAPRQRP